MSFSVIHNSPSGAAVYYSGAYAHATGATGSGGIYATAASAANWDSVSFKNAAYTAGYTLATGSSGTALNSVLFSPASIIGGATPIGDVRGEQTGYSLVSSSTVVGLDTEKQYTGALYAVYSADGVDKLTGKVGVGTTNFTGNGYYAGIFTTRDNHDFETDLTVDTGNLNLTGLGSGVYTIGETVTLQTSLIDRIGNSLNTVSSITEDSFVKSLKISILDEDRNIIYGDYKTDYKNPSFTFTKQENIDLFGSFTKNFGVRFTVENQDGGSHDTDFLLYGNRLSIDKIYVSASGGTYLDENPDNDYGPSTGTISNAADRIAALSGFSHRLINTSGTTGAINFNVTFDQTPNFTDYDNLLVFAHTGTSVFDTTTENLLGTFPLTQLENQNIRIFPDDGVEEGEPNFFKFVASSEIGFYNELFTVGPYTLEPVEVGTDPILYNVGEQEIVSGNLSILGDGAGGLYALGASGTGYGQRITGPGHLPYLLSGDPTAETQNLQQVTDIGNTTTNSIISSGPYVSGKSGLFNYLGIGTTIPFDPFGGIEVKRKNSPTTAPPFSVSTTYGNVAIGKTAGAPEAGDPYTFRIEAKPIGVSTGASGTKFIVGSGADKGVGIGTSVVPTGNTLEVVGIGTTVPSFTVGSGSGTAGVGIGTTYAPADKTLEVVGLGTTSPSIVVGIGSTATATVGIGTSAAPTGKNTFEVVGIGTTTPSFVVGSGSGTAGVGIGTTEAPTTKTFEVVGLGTTSPSIVVGIGSTATATVGIGTSAAPTGKNTFEVVGIGTTAPSLVVGTGSGTANVGIGTTEAPTSNTFEVVGIGSTNPSIAVKAGIGTTAGYVGIGSSNPSFPLDASTIEKANIAAANSYIYSTGSAIFGGANHIISGDFDVIAGGGKANISGGTFNFIGGGTGVNVDHSNYSSSVGGFDNDIFSGSYSVIGGGRQNLISGKASESHSDNTAILGGQQNKVISAPYSFIGGGNSNLITGTSAIYSAILGGNNSHITNSQYGVILGGDNNKINYANSALAAGNYSTVQSGHNGAFVLSDSRTAEYQSTGGNTLNLRFQSGVFVDTDSGIYINGNPVVTGSSDTDVDTLQTVTDRGASTTNAITIDTASDISLIVGSTDSTARIQLNDDDTTGYLSINSTSLALGHTTTLGDQTLHLTSAGNVGIGTNAPKVELDVKGDISGAKGTFTGQLTTLDKLAVGTPYSSYNATIDGTLQVKDVTNGTYDGLLFTSNVGGEGRIAATNTDHGTKHPLQLKGEYIRFLAQTGTAVEAMRIVQGSDGSGYVGIGTDDPDSKLHIYAGNPNIFLEESDASSTFNITDIQLAGGALNINTRQSNGSFVSTDYQIAKNANGATDHKFFIAGSEKVRIGSNGAVGIGTASPIGGYSLNVTGDIFVGDNSAGAVGRNFVAYSASLGVGKNSVATIVGKSVKASSATNNSLVTLPYSTDGTLWYKQSYAAGHTWHRTTGYATSTTISESEGELMRLTTGGNVGIGTNAPAFRLDVRSADDTLAYFKSSDNKASIYIADNDSAGYVSTENDYMSIGPHGGLNTGNININLSEGNVGINTKSPEEKLHVGGDIRVGTGGAADYNRVEFTRYGGAIVGGIGWHSDSIFYVAGHPSFGPTAGNDVRVYGFGGDLHLGDNANGDVLTIDYTNGDVGIGTAAPSGTLHILGGYDANDPKTLVIAGREHSSTVYGGIQFERAGGGTFFGIGNDSRTDRDEIYIGGGFGGVKAATAIRMLTEGPYGSTIGEERLTIVSGGNVGIGTDSPNSKLEVDGEVRITSSAAYHTHLNYDDGGNNFISQANGGFTQFRNSAGTLMQLRSNGSLGIGANAPSTTLLAVSGAISDSLGVFIDGDDGVEITTRGSLRQQIDFLGTNTSAINAKGSLWINYDTNNDGSNDVITFARNAADEAGTVDMVITEGKVGIGSAAPAYKLDVAGDIQAKDSFVTVGFGSTRGYQFHDLGTGYGFKGIGSPTRLGVLVQGIESMTFESNGRVGIGSTNPENYKLEVIGDISGSGSFFGTGVGSRITNNGTPYLLSGDAAAALTLQDVCDNGNVTTTSIAANIITGASLDITGANSTFKAYENANDDFRIGTWTADDISIITNGSRRLTVTDAGNVGIGTNDPYLKFYVDGNSRVEGNLMVGDAARANTPSVALHIKSSSTNAKLRIEDSDSSNQYWDFYVNQGDGLHFNEDTENRVTFKEGGNVGIGTNNPATLLQVSGGDITIQGADGESRWFGFTSSASANTYVAKIESDHAANWGGNLKFFTGPAGGGNAERMRIAGDGDVGIGTPTPNAKLDVRGDISGSGNFYGTGVGSRITNNGTPYLLSGDAAAALTLQQVTDNGDTTTNSVYIHGSGDDVNYAPLNVSGNTTLAFFRGTGTAAYLQFQNSTTSYGSSSQQGLTVGNNGNDGYVFNREAASLYFGTSGEARMTILGDNTHSKVGIGTIAPASTAGSDSFLEVYGAADAGLVISSNNGEWDLKNTNPTANLSLFAAGSHRVTFAYAGNVGIGSATPGYKLDVGGDIGIGDYAMMKSTSNYMGMIGFNRNGNDGAIYNNAYGAFQLQNYNGLLELQCYNTGGVIQQKHGFTSAGNVGIGTTNPQSHLTVAHGGNATVTITGNGIAIFNLFDDNTAAGINTYDDGTLRLHSYQDAASKQLVLSGTNKVGIGTHTPNATLDVRGDISGSGNFYGTGVGSRITNNGTPYLLSGDAAAALTLQDVCDNGNTTTTTIESTKEAATAFSATSGTDRYFVVDASGRIGLNAGFSPTHSIEIDNWGNKRPANIWLNSSTLHDASIEFSHNGAYGFIMGSDETDRKFKISSGNALGTNDRLVIDTAGNVEIGKDTDVYAEIGPSHVGYIGHSDYAGFSHIDRNNTTDYALLQDQYGTTIINSAASKDIRFGIGNVNVGVWDAAGRVGIGTDDPLTSLHVVDDKSEFVSADVPSDTIAVFENSGNARIAIIGDADDTCDLFFGDQHDGDVGRVRYNHVSNYMAFFTNGSEKMRIKSGGQVGIGTDSPSNALDVVGHFSATSKSFLIDHPTKENKKLQYASLEGPENGVYVRGTTNSKIIELPEYWTELVHEDSITVVLTPIGKKQNLYIKSKTPENVMVGGVEGSYDYVIYGERKDVDKLEVEPLKV